MMLFSMSPLWLKLALAYARIAPVFFLLPFLSGQFLGSLLLKNALIMLIALGFLPVLPDASVATPGVSLLASCVLEGLIGLALGLVLVLPFWLIHAVGALIDNQRGATLANTLDPLYGVETSEISNLFNYFFGAVYLQAGGMHWLLASLAASYRLLPAGGSIQFNLTQLSGLLNTLLAHAIVLAAPVVLCLLLTEVALGVLSRFAQQLNAFSVAMSVKSLVAFALLFLYGLPLLQQLALRMPDLGQLIKLISRAG